MDLWTIDFGQRRIDKGQWPKENRLWTIDFQEIIVIKKIQKPASQNLPVFYFKQELLQQPSLKPTIILPC